MANPSVLGSKISLISKSEIRYEGILYTIDPKAATVALAKVKLCGTEGRPAEIPVYPRDEIYEYIIFRASDIKDLHVCSDHVCSDSKSFSGLPRDPAIVQHFQSLPPQFSSLTLGQPFASLTGLAPFPQASSQISYSQMPHILTQAQYSGSSRSMNQSLKKSPTSDAGVQVSVGKSDMIQSSHENREPMRQRNRMQNQQNMPIRRRMPMNRNPGRQGVLRRGGRRPPPTIAESFENDYDFEKANAEFLELENKLSKANTGSVGDSTESAEDISGAYDRDKSFFDDISCEASQRSKGMQRFDWRNERRLNVETFGMYANNAWIRRRRSRGGYNRARGSYRGRGVPTRQSETPMQKTVHFDETPEIKEVEVIALEDKPAPLPIIEVITKEEKSDWPETSTASAESIWN